ncbi:MAG: phosphatidate cytidylyltransferase [Lachnospiraceae bacterium]|nr:phosphatidate cytidylyltransferase [Lachnospiraceae bacterium]
MAGDINKDNSFLIRFRSSVILMIITVASIVLGGYVLWGVTLIVTLIGMMELYRAVRANRAPAAFVGYLAAIGWYVLLLLGFINNNKGLEDEKGLALLVAVFLIILLAFYVFGFPKYNSEQITMIFFGLFYVAFTLSCIFRLRISAGGAYTVWLIFIGSWGADTSAYLVGRKIGRHKIVPVLSPKKSLEGFIGGVVGAVLIGIIYALIFKKQLSAYFASPVIAFAVISAVASVVSMIGDLAASAIKRNKEIKDYGRLIPGHGGILDRFDSVIFIAPIVYYLVIFTGTA